jgi:hypothetical protein
VTALLKANLIMTKVSRTSAGQNDRMAHLSAELASSVYQVTLRETKPQSWLDLELDLWKAISNKLAMKDTDSH